MTARVCNSSLRAVGCGYPAVVLAVLALLAACDGGPARRPLNPLLITRNMASGPTVEPSPGGAATGARDEVWIIARDPAQPASNPAAPAVGTGTLPYIRRPGAEADGLAVTLAEVQAAVAGPAAAVTIRQGYRNTTAERIAVEYVFSLPADAMVTDFVMTIGPRQIRGLIRERAEAERIHAEAGRAGLVAALLTQDEANGFTHAIANLEPGQPIEVATTYFTALGYRDGEHELVLPLAVAPPAAAGELHVTVDIDAGMSIEAIHSPSHTIAVERTGAERAHIELPNDAGETGRQLVLRYRTTGPEMRSGLLSHRDPRGGFFALMLQAPASGRAAPLTGIQVDWGGLEVSEVCPQTIAKVTSGQPLVLSGRFHSPVATRIEISGTSGGRHLSYTIPVSTDDLEEDHPALIGLWLRAHAMATEAAAPSESGRESAEDVALQYGVVSPRTGILATDAQSPRGGVPSSPAAAVSPTP